MDKIISAIEFRLDQLNKTQQIINSDPSNFSMSKLDNEARIDELETLLDYIKNNVK